MIPQTLPIQHIIAIASAKGGVGKSTVATNLTLALKRINPKAKLGLLDADIYGPSQPFMLGTKATAHVTHNKQFIPIERHGIQTISIDYLMRSNPPLMWRGPMISKALQQLLYSTQWDPLDYLILDLPPGTGDIPLTLIQKVPLTGATIITTPQTVAVLDAKKSLMMFEQLHIPVLGIIENMSSYQCPHCGHHDPLFSQGGGKQLAEHHQLPLLGQLPFDPLVLKQGEKGTPIVISHPDSHIAQLYQTIAHSLLNQIKTLPSSAKAVN